MKSLYARYAVVNEVDATIFNVEIATNTPLKLFDDGEVTFRHSDPELLYYTTFTACKKALLKQLSARIRGLQFISQQIRTLKKSDVDAVSKNKQC